MEERGEPEELAHEPQPTDSRRGGAMLADARAKAKLDLADVSEKTRIPLRHLEAIEAGEYAKLPSRTYAVGFSRTYARLLGLDERAVTDQIRRDLETREPEGPVRPDRFEPGDPARVPSRRLAWLSALAVIVLLVGAFTFYRTYFSPGLGPAPLTDPATATPAAATDAAAVAISTADANAVAGGPVVFTSLVDGAWIKFYDASGKRLYEAQMAKGDSFTIPADADGPLAWTGRPDAFAITVGGRSVAPLGEAEAVMKDVPVTAEALLARPTPSAPATPADGAAGTAR